MAETPNKGENEPGTPGTNGDPADIQTDTVAKADYDKLVADNAALRKDKEQAELERNQKRNAAAEAEKAKAEQDKDFEKLFQIMKAEAEEVKSKYETTTRSTLTDRAREDALAKLPDKLRDSAKDLLAKATTPEQVAEKAAEVLTLAKSLGLDIEGLPTSPVTALNSRPASVQTPAKQKTQSQWRDELHARALREAGR